MDFPFREKSLGGKLFLREFKENVNPEELIWHQDREDRVIKVVESNGWKLQLDNQLPVLLEKDSTYNIPAYVYHRVIKGSGRLLIEVEKNK
jgi:hypothetical protein